MFPSSCAPVPWLYIYVTDEQLRKICTRKLLLEMELSARGLGDWLACLCLILCFHLHLLQLNVVNSVSSSEDIKPLPGLPGIGNMNYPSTSPGSLVKHICAICGDRSSGMVPWDGVPEKGSLLCSTCMQHPVTWKDPLRWSSGGWGRGKLAYGLCSWGPKPIVLMILKHIFYLERLASVKMFQRLLSGATQ